ncbi:MAG TPA: hypothetical protein VGZ29_05715 [Terriglobia bacterium]|nr:hypothetical protein [Terriglobia bacterium]
MILLRLRSSLFTFGLGLLVGIILARTAWPVRLLLGAFALAAIADVAEGLRKGGQKHE